MCGATYDLLRTYGKHWWGIGRKEEQQDFSDWAFIHSHLPDDLPDELYFENGLRCFEFYYKGSPTQYPEDMKKHIANYTAFLTVRNKL